MKKFILTAVIACFMTGAYAQESHSQKAKEKTEKADTTKKAKKPVKTVPPAKKEDKKAEEAK